MLQSEGQADPAGPAARVSVHQVDASEGSALSDRFGFRSVPFFLM